MSNIAPDEKILCFNCYKAYYQKVVKDFVFTDENTSQVITVPDVLTSICPKCNDVKCRTPLKIKSFINIKV